MGDKISAAAAALGRRGGASRSEAKRAASRANGTTRAHSRTHEEIVSGYADRVYLAVYGDSDSKALRAEKTTEIYDWLMNADRYIGAHASIRALVAEWREYEAEA